MASDKSKRARMASRSRMRLALSLACATVLAAHCIVGDASADDAATFVIDANTQLKDVFQCSPVKPIGFYNEYYVTCTFSAPSPQNTTELKSLEVRNAVLDGAQLSPYGSVHVELLFELNSALTVMTIDNSTIRASAVGIQASAITLHATSSLNVSANGLKFGPGFNSRVDMGGGYGGMGGASLTTLHRSCDHIRPNNFYRAIGDASGDLGDFQGYGSGGGNGDARGGGRISLVAQKDVLVNGTVLANGGDACVDCDDSAGAGGTITINAGGRIYGSGVVQASGGEPALFDDTEFIGIGGGGGGGGGRIVLEAKNSEELDPSHVEAFGGGSPPPKGNSLIQWCQLGGDGTILKLQHTLQDDDGDKVSEDREGDDPEVVIGTLVVKGGRLKHEGPAKRIQIYGCTPIYNVASSGWQPFLPDAVAHIFVSGGATACGSYVKLQTTVSGIKSSIVVDAGSQVNSLEGNRSVHLAASQLTIQGFIGPSSQSEEDLFQLRLEGTDVSISNGLLLVELLDIIATGSLDFDKYSVSKFRFGIVVQTGRQTTIEGFLQPLDPPSDAEFVSRGDDDTPFVRLESGKNVTLRPQPGQLGAMQISVKAGETAIVDLPFDTPFLSLSVVAKNATVVHVGSGPIRKCEPIKYQTDDQACKTLADAPLDRSPYGVSVFASKIAQLGNISAGAILLCSDDMITVEGTISARSLGCESGSGPGKSGVIGGASGGAGHGGRGGNIQPGNTGGGASYDVSAAFWAFPQKQFLTSRLLLAPQDEDAKWPMWPGSGASSGDTPDQIVGGNGGGVIYIGSTTLEVLKDAEISVRGGDGSKRGGGGSGGSMALFISEISGGGVIDLEGGEAVNPSHVTGAAAATDSETAIATDKADVWSSDVLPLDFIDDETKKLGGGGGGGVIRITYHKAKEMANSGEKFVKDGGKLSVQGGKSSGGEAGVTGVQAASNCEPGRGDVFCLQCPEGSYSPGALSKCVPCEPGSCSSQVGAASCDKCSIGTFNADFGKKVCVACPIGHFAEKNGSKVCAPCGPGRFASGTGSSSCGFCPIGTISTVTGSTNCTVCGIGETTLKVGSIKCSTCHDKPDHSQFNVRGNCTYACDKGRNGLDCLTPFERLVKPIGGPLGFVLLVFSLTGALFGIWGFISYRSSQFQKRRFAEYKAQTLRDQLSLAKLTRNLTPRLTDQDLDAHLARLYFSGDNHLESSWTLNASYLPLAMREIVYEGLYLSFASTCNQLLRWDTKGWDAWVYRFLLCVIPPVGTLFKRRRQLRRVEKLAKYIEEHGAGFFREMTFRVHGAKLKIGFSPDFSLAYIDVLVPPGVSSLSLLDTRHIGSLTIVVAGSGSFFRPYHIDTNDIYVRAVPSRLELLKHDFWINFVADVNQKLRVIPQPTSPAQITESAHKVKDLLAFVETFNRRHEGDGFVVAFGFFSVESAVNAESNEDCFACWELGTVDEVLQGFNQDPFKFAFQIKKSWEEEGSTSVGREHLSLGEEDTLTVDGDSSSLRKHSPRELNDPQPAEFRFSQIRMEALFADSDSLSPREGAEMHTLLSPTSKKRAGAGGATSTANNALAALVSRESLRRVFALLQPLSPLFGLYNVAPPTTMSSRAWLLPFSLLMLIVLDFALVFWILMEYYCIQVEDPTASDSGCSRVAVLSVVWILPAAILGAPGIGLVFIAKKSVFYGKLFGVWNVGSIINVFVAFVCGLAYYSFIHEGVLAVIVALIVVKYAEKAITLRCIAQYACERPLRGWRGLYTTKDWYDSAYTPLVHQEN
ncbi:hypothetical protein Gpo141_00010872 [Globisporangium polare]